MSSKSEILIKKIKQGTFSVDILTKTAILSFYCTVTNNVEEIMIKKTKTFVAKPTEIERACYIIDAKDKVLGRIASRVASILRGKHKPIYTPHVDTGDMVIIINAEKVRVTGAKLQKKTYQRYSGYPSGQKSVVMKDMMAQKPTFALKHAITGMLPKGALGSKMGKKLKVYAGDKHTHSAQKPIALEV